MSTPIKLVKLHLQNETSSDKGLLTGVQLFDFNGAIVLIAGDSTTDEFSQVFDIELKPNERLIGLKCGRRGHMYAWNYDVQFLIGKPA